MLIKPVELYEIYVNTVMELYFKFRYGNCWRWYYLNYEVNREVLL